MGLIAFLKFDRYSGAMVSDEEFWSLRFRRKLYSDNMHSLLDEDISQASGMEVVYGGTGYPSFNHEIITQTRSRIRERFHAKGSKKKKPAPVKTVADVAGITCEVMNDVLRRRIDLRMKFFYGYTTDDLNRGYFEENGERFDIRQEGVKKKSLDMAAGNEPSRLMKNIFKSRAAILGFDSKTGMTGYYLDPRNRVVCYNYEGWEAIGAGKYASGLVLGQFLNRKNLKTRNEGYDPAEGIFELISAGLIAAENYHEAGGNINIVCLDSRGKTHNERYREIFDDRARLAGEIVRAQTAGILDRAAAFQLLNKLLFQKHSHSSVESELFQKTTDTGYLELLLRGYKLDEIPAIVKMKPGKQISRKPAGRTRKGGAR